VRPLRRERQFMPSTGTEISFVRFLGGRADLCRSRHSFLALLRQGSSLDQAMNQPVSGSPVVTHHLGALIALGTLLAVNLAWMSKFFSAGGELTGHLNRSCDRAKK
jgi:hypothetical protein